MLVCNLMLFFGALAAVSISGVLLFLQNWNHCSSIVLCTLCQVGLDRRNADCPPNSCSIHEDWRLGERAIWDLAVSKEEIQMGEILEQLCLRWQPEPLYVCPHSSFPKGIRLLLTAALNFKASQHQVSTAICHHEALSSTLQENTFLWVCDVCLPFCLPFQGMDMKYTHLKAGTCVSCHHGWHWELNWGLGELKACPAPV